MNFKELGENLGLEEDEYRELVDLFIMTGSADFQKIKDGLAANDVDLVVRSAHTIKGASGNLGLMAVSETAKFIEDQAVENRLERLDEAVQTMKRQLEEIQAFVKLSQ